MYTGTTDKSTPPPIMTRIKIITCIKAWTAEDEGRRKRRCITGRKEAILPPRHFILLVEDYLYF